jgi:hypothetical protein
MKQIKPGIGFTTFIIFFGIALLEAFRKQNLWEISFWVLMGAIFLLFDIKNKKEEV